LKRLNEPELALHAGRVLAQRSPQVAIGQPEPVLEIAPAGVIDGPATKSGEEIEHFEAGEIGINAHLAGEVSDIGPCVQPLALAIVSEDEGVAGGWTEEVEENADGGGFAGAVESEKAEDLAGSDVEVQIVYGYQFAILLAKTPD
jgi:hypothetical protein